MTINQILDGDHGRELEQRYNEFRDATAKAAAALSRYGMDSDEFAIADNAAGIIMERINRLLGRRHWVE